jgi:uncharacterized membrane protein (UPF0127 family)
VKKSAAPWLTVGLASVCVLACAFTGCDKGKTQTVAAPPQPEIDPLRGHLLKAQPKLPTIKVWLGAQELVAEVATQPLQIATGMMFRTNLLENEGMLFVFGDVAPRNFYMRNCTVPLSAAYIGPDGVILEIAKLDPGDEVGVQSTNSNIQFVLEVRQGWFERHNVPAGSVVRTERGSLAETFFRRPQP